MTPGEIELVQTSFRSVKPIADQAADLFYGRLFEIAPEVRPLFPDDLTEQKKKLMGMLATAVSNLHQVEKIVPAVRGPGSPPFRLRRHRRPLQAGRRGAAVDAGEGARRRLHAAGQGGLDRRLHHARLRHDVGGGKGSATSAAGAQGNPGPPVRLRERAMQRRLLVVGNGMSSLRLLEELVALAPERFDVTVVGAEASPAYNRVLLSPLLAGELAAADVELRPAAWYAENGITLRTGQPVLALDPIGRNAQLGDGERLAFDVCVLATGSEPIVLPLPGSDLAGVTTFRSHDDIATMRAAVATGLPAVVIGGGLLGIEAAYGLARTGAKVTLVHLMDRLMERQLDAEAARLLQAGDRGQGHPRSAALFDPRHPRRPARACGRARGRAHRFPPHWS